MPLWLGLVGKVPAIFPGEWGLDHEEIPRGIRVMSAACRDPGRRVRGYQPNENPPSMVITWPVMKDAWSEANITAQAEMSPGRPNRLIN